MTSDPGARQGAQRRGGPGATLGGALLGAGGLRRGGGSRVAAGNFLENPVINMDEPLYFIYIYLCFIILGMTLCFLGRLVGPRI